MLNIIVRTIRSKRNSILAYSVIGTCFMWMYTAIFPSFAKESDKFSEILKTMPKGMLEVFGLDSANFTNMKLESFLATEMFTLIWPIMTLALIVSLGSSAVAGEVEGKTIDILLSQPISRIKLFFSKYLSAVSSFLIYATITIFSVIPIATAYNLEYRTSHFATLYILGFFFGLSVLSMSMLTSSVFSEKGKSSLTAGGILIVMYAINIASLLIEKLEPLKYTSLFHYFDTSSALNDNEINMLSIYAFLIVIIVTTSLGAYIFNRRDISV